MNIKKVLFFLVTIIFVNSQLLAIDSDLIIRKKEHHTFLEENKLQKATLDLLPIHFKDHLPVWFLVSGADIAMMKLHLQDQIQTPRMSQPGLNEEGVSGGLSIGGGINTPLIGFGEDASLRLSAHSAVSFSDEYTTFKLPVYINFHLGKGSNTYTEAEYTLTAGAGYALNYFYYFDQFNYAFAQLTPAVMAEAGFKRFVLRVDYFLNTHHAQFYDISYAEFRTFSFGCVFYLGD